MGGVPRVADQQVNPVREFRCSWMQFTETIGPGSDHLGCVI